MPQTAVVQGNQPFLKGSVIWQKKGPLPVWAWLIIGLALAFVVMWWRRNSAATDATTAATGQTEMPSNQGAPPIFIVPSAATPAVNVPVTVVPHDNPVTVPTAPPGGGAPIPRQPVALPPAQAPATMSVRLEENIYQWIEGLNREYPGLSLDFGKLEMMNPGMRQYIRWDPAAPGTNYKIPKFFKWHPTLGVPPMRIR